MPQLLHRPAIIATFAALVLLLGAATQAPKFPGGVFKANDGTNNIAISFDSAGVLNVYVQDQSFAQSSWEVKADTLSFGYVTGPEGYACTTGARYLWAFADNKMTFKQVGTDDCAARRDPLLGLIWTRG